MLILGVYFTYKNNKVDRSYQFNGTVDSVSYDIKGKAEVIIKNKKYYLDNNDWDFDQNRIKKGDSLIKEKNSLIIKLIKTNGQIVIEGK